MSSISKGSSFKLCCVLNFLNYGDYNESLHNSKDLFVPTPSGPHGMDIMTVGERRQRNKVFVHLYLSPPCVCLAQGPS